MTQTAESGYYHQVWKKINAEPSNIVTEAIDGAKKAQEENYIYITEVYRAFKNPFITAETTTPYL